MEFEALAALIAGPCGGLVVAVYFLRAFISFQKDTIARLMFAYSILRSWLRNSVGVISKMGFYESDRIRRKQKLVKKIIKKREDMGKAEEVSVSVADDLLRLLWKVFKYGKGGYTKEEARDLGEDLLALAFEVLEKALDKED